MSDLPWEVPGVVNYRPQAEVLRLSKDPADILALPTLADIRGVLCTSGGVQNPPSTWRTDAELAADCREAAEDNERSARFHARRGREDGSAAHTECAEWLTERAKTWRELAGRLDPPRLFGEAVR